MMFVVKDGQPQEPELVLLDDVWLKIQRALEEDENISEIEFKGHELYVDKFAAELFENLKGTRYANRNVRILTNGEIFTE